MGTDDVVIYTQEESYKKCFLRNFGGTQLRSD